LIYLKRDEEEENNRCGTHERSGTQCTHPHRQLAHVLRRVQMMVFVDGGLFILGMRVIMRVCVRKYGVRVVSIVRVSVGVRVIGAVSVGMLMGSMHVRMRVSGEPRQHEADHQQERNREHLPSEATKHQHNYQERRVGVCCGLGCACVVVGSLTRQ
jgi:hypothetical protein